jgi:hypothetical protein
LPPRPDLDRLRREAKALKAGNPEIRTLAAAQRALARDYGFANWPAMKAAVETSRDLADRIAARRARAEAGQARIVALADTLLALARAGDALAIASRPGVGRTIGLQVRDRIAADPEHWRIVVDALIAGLGHGNPKVRFECAHALDTYADLRARDALAPLIDDPVPRVRWMAMHALACDACKIEAPPFAEAICERIAVHALEDDSIQVRRHAAWQLALCGGPLAVRTLDVMLDREADPAIRRNAMAARRKLLAAQAPGWQD